MRYLAAFLILSLLGMAPRSKAQQDPFDAVAADAAAAIAKASRKNDVVPKVLVADFVETRGHKTALGADLARQFFLGLQTHARNFTFADRDEYLRKFAADMVAPQSYDDLDTMRCVASDLAADFVVTGELDDLPDSVALWIRVARVEDRKLLFDKRVSLPLTPAMEQLLRQAPEALASSNSNGSTAGSPDRARAPAGGANGYSQPACVYCPNPQFSDAALKQKFQGTVVMNVRIGLDGRAHDLAIVRGLPCGLNGQAIDAVRRWNFRPANGPDGEPAEVATVVEITFRLY
jgi:TonB family protein